MDTSLDDEIIFYLQHFGVSSTRYFNPDIFTETELKRHQVIIDELERKGLIKFEKECLLGKHYIPTKKGQKFYQKIQQAYNSSK